MEEGDLVPVKDVSIGGFKQQLSLVNEDKGVDIASRYGQRAVAKWTREQLEDRYYTITEENVTLKRHALKQEDKIKRMATKLIRLVHDKKRQQGSGFAKRRDFETDQLIEELEDKARDLEKNNKILNDKLLVLRQQLASQLKRPTFGPYRHVSARVDSGVNNKPGIIRTASSASNINGGRTYTKLEIPQVLDVATEHLQEQIEMLQQQTQTLKQQLEMKDDEIVTLKSQLSQEHKQVLHDNVSTIKLQRENKHKTSQISFLEKSCQDLEERLQILNRNEDELIQKLELANQKLRKADDTIVNLKGQMSSFVTANMTINELKERNDDLFKENQLLKESNERLMSSALNADKQRTPLEPTKAVTKVTVVEDHQMQLKVVELEKLNSYLKLELDKEKHLQEKLESELEELRVKYEKLINKPPEIVAEQRLVPDEIGVDELDKAMKFIQQQKNSQLNTELGLSPEDEEQIDSLRQKLLKEQANHAETIEELEKTRNMLVLQHKINKDYQLQVEAMVEKMDGLKEELEKEILAKVEEVKILQIKIDQLEKQRKDKILSYSPTKAAKAIESFIAEKLERQLELDKPGENNVDNVIKQVEAPIVCDTSISNNIKNETGNKKLFEVVDSDSEPNVDVQKEEEALAIEATILNEPQTPVVIEAEPVPSSVSIPVPRPRTAKLIKPNSDLVVEVTSTGSKIPIIINNPSAHCFSSGSSSENDSDVEMVVAVNNKKKSESDSDAIVTAIDKPVENIIDIQCPPIVIIISHLKLSSKSSIMKNAAITTLFIEYQFLDYPADELETPFSLPKPKNTKNKLSFNFKKVFYLDADKVLQLKHLLASPSKSRIKFTVVGEPADENEDCEEVGVAYVAIDKIVKGGKDIVKQNVDVCEIKKSTKLLGQLNVTVEMIDAIKFLQK
ncbi:X-linked retinitis pigmentosa GTPase regulator-interacting protein 1 [Chamberlinius hualienensis]